MSMEDDQLDGLSGIDTGDLEADFSSGAKPVDFDKFLGLLETTPTTSVRGRVTEVTGLVIKAAVPGVKTGELCYVETAEGMLKCEVVGFKDEAVMLMPLGEATGIGPDSEVIPTGKPFSIKA